MDKLRILSVLLCIGLALTIQAQPISLQAGRMKSIKRDGHTIQKLRENVHFEQSGSNVYCDEAEYDPISEDLHGSGNVRIINPDGAIVTGRILDYNNANHNARVSGNVKLVDGSMELRTPWIEYNTANKLGWYDNGGTIVDKETLLSSRSGSYNSAQKTLFFKNQVVLTTPEYTVKTDTLQYQTDTKKALFFSLTQLDYLNTIVIFKSGWYNTLLQLGEFYGDVGLFDQVKIVVCDTLVFNKITEIGLASGHVYSIDTQEHLQVWGQHAQYRGKEKIISIWDQALAFQGKDKNMLQIKADTLYYNSDSSQSLAFKAIHNVAFSQGTLTGTCTILKSMRSDSTFYFSGNPVLWDSTLSRLSGDSIEMKVVQNQIKTLRAFPNAFVCILEDSSHFSQAKGDSILQEFNNTQQIEKVKIFKNAESIYYLRENDTLQTVNSVISRHMQFGFNKNTINQITLYDKPQGILYPLDQFPIEKQKLKGFIWDIQNKPNRQTFVSGIKPLIPVFPYPKTPTIKTPRKKEKKG